MTQTLAFIACLTSSLVLAQTVPGSISFNARLTDTAGAPVTGSHAMAFGLYTSASGGAAVWTENVSAASFSTEGVAFVELGAVTSLTTSALDGSKLYLEVSVDGTTMSPRLAIVSVPYAIRASLAASALSVGSLTEAAIQRRVTGTCNAGQAVRSIDAAGGVQCENLASGGGDITSVTTAAGSGLTGGATTGDVALGLATCASGEVLRSNGASWACAPVGSVTSISAAAPLSVTNPTTTPVLALAPASGSSDGYLRAADFSAFAGKRTQGGGNLIEWTPDVPKWTYLAGTAGTVTLNNTDVLEGGSSFDLTINTGATGTVYTYGDLIPIDPARRYRGELAAKLVTGAGTFFAGYVAYSAAGATLAGNGGTYGYFIASGVTLTAGWSRYSGSIQGEGTALDQFPVGTRFIRPLVIANYMNIGKTRVDSFSIMEVPTVRSVPRVSQNGPADTTCDVNSACGPSPLATRTLVMNKLYGDTDLRLLYTDTMRSYGISPAASRVCRWHIYVDGNPCPSGDVRGVVYASPWSDSHEVRTLIGYCRGLAVGPHSVQVYVSNQPGYEARCYTGWPGDVTWTMEAEEVR